MNFLYMRAKRVAVLQFLFVKYSDINSAYLMIVLINIGKISFRMY